VSVVNAACFACGWLAAAVALVSPLDALAGRLFWVHMVQHELLMLVAAPLLVVARPIGAFGWALPPRWSQILGRLMHRRLVHRWWRALTAPLPAWSLHAAALWVWHVPALFNATQASEALHAVQHLSFFTTAIAFWWACLGRWHGRLASGAAVLYLLTTMIHTGVLGALLALSGTAWYASAAPAYGLTPLEDQQLGGLIMWVPAGAVYAGVGLALLARWLTLANGSAHLAGASRRT
jgi:putative membrane protein